MNDYRQRFGLNRQFQPSTTSMGKFFANRLRDSMHFTSGLTTNERENFDQTSADYEATPEPPISLYDINRSIITPSSTASTTNESYFTHTAPDTHKFSRRVELSSGYNILKNRNSSRPTRLPAYLQGRTPLAQLNPLPSSTKITTNNNNDDNPDENRQRRLSFTDHNRIQYLTANQQLLQQFNLDGTRRPFSSDSPLPPPLPTTTTTSTITNYYISSAPPVHNRSTYEPIEPIKLVSEQEDSSIAALSRELRAAAYPTTRKSSNYSPTHDTSPSTTHYSTRINTKRPPPRSLPKLHSLDQQQPQPPPSQPQQQQQQQPIISNMKMTHYYHHHELEKVPPAPPIDDHFQSPSTSSLLLDQFFNSDSTHETLPINNDKHEHSQSSALLMRTPSLPNPSEDTTMSFVSKYARLAPIPISQPIASTSEISTNHHDETLDHTLHDLSSFHNETIPITDDLLPSTTDMINNNNLDHTIDDIDENYSYIPLKEQIKNSIDGIPLLELDELETNSDISESQLVPIIYAKELANEIDLLQRAHLLKQQQKSNLIHNDNERINDNSSVPPPANMELLNFEALEEEFSHLQPQEITPSPSPMMEISSPPPPASLTTKESESLLSPLPIKQSESPPSSITENETIMTNLLQHSILAHNRSSPWFKLPTELWFKILPYLTTNDLHHFSYVCKRFYLLVQDQSCHHKIIINQRMKLEQIWFDAISRRKPMSLSFIKCRQQDLENTPQQQQQSIQTDSENIKWLEFFQTIGSTLLDFTMSGCYHEPFTPNTLLPIIVKTCTNLQSLTLQWNNITESTLNHLIDYPQFIHLHTLDLTGCQILDDTLLINIFIRNETNINLKKLILQACANLTWISLDTIANCIPNLIHLNVSRCIGLKNLSSNQNLTCFHYWPNLQSIDFGYLLTLTDNDLTIVFDNCKYLNTLIVDDCIHVTDQILNRLNENFRMISLNNCTNLTTNLFLTLNDQCPNLQTINLSSIKNFNDTCLSKWSEKPLNQLKTLILDYCTECTLNSIENFLEKHINLTKISLIGNNILNVIDQQRLQTKFPNILFVFQ